MITWAGSLLHIQGSCAMGHWPMYQSDKPTQVNLFSLVPTENTHLCDWRLAMRDLPHL